jgi:hypothetical protein
MTQRPGNGYFWTRAVGYLGLALAIGYGRPWWTGVAAVAASWLIVGALAGELEETTR